MAREYGYKEVDAAPAGSLNGFPWRVTSSSISRGLAAMPAPERPLRIDGRGRGGGPSYPHRRPPEAMASKTSPQGSSPRADLQHPQWDDADWDHDHDEAG